MNEEIIFKWDREWDREYVGKCIWKMVCKRKKENEMKERKII